MRPITVAILMFVSLPGCGHSPEGVHKNSPSVRPGKLAQTPGSQTVPPSTDVNNRSKMTASKTDSEIVKQYVATLSEEAVNIDVALAKLPNVGFAPDPRIKIDMAPTVADFDQLLVRAKAFKPPSICDVTHAKYLSFLTINTEFLRSLKAQLEDQSEHPSFNGRYAARDVEEIVKILGESISNLCKKYSVKVLGPLKNTFHAVDLPDPYEP